MRLNLRAGIVIIVGIWCLMVVVLNTAYGATLLSFLSVTKLGPAINSLDELTKSKSCQLIVQGGADLTNDFFVSPHSSNTHQQQHFFFHGQIQCVRFIAECNERNVQTDW